MHSAELVQLEKSLGFSLKVMAIDWEKFKQDYGFTYTNEADEAADRRYFNWHHFRGVHDPQSCLLDEEGHVRGIILRGTVSVPVLTLQPLPALEYLCVCDNEQLTTFSMPGLFPLLQHVELSNNQLQSFVLTESQPLLRYLNLRNNKLTNLDLAAELPSLQTLDAIDNQLTSLELPGKLPALEYLELSNNQLKSIVSTSDFSRLRKLNLKKNQLEELPKGRYDKLETLYVSENPLKGFEESLIKGDDKGGNAKEIIAQLRAFAASGERPNDRVKLIVVGNGRVGKTSLVKRLKGLKYDPDEVYTHGVDISELTKENFPGVKTESLQLKVWDFGGQEVFYATHQFFMSEEAAYLYVWTDKELAKRNKANDKKKSPADERWRSHQYWLDNIRMHGKDSPLIVIKTHASDAKEAFPEGLTDMYDAVDGVQNFDADDERPRILNNLRDALTKRINDLPLLGVPTPVSFYNLIDRMNALRHEGKHEISRATFGTHAAEANIAEVDTEAALSYLHKIGEVIYLGDKEELKDKIFIDPRKLTERVYKLIDASEELKDKEGQFNAEYAADVLGKDWSVLLALLEGFELIFQRQDGEYIAPQYLPKIAQVSRNQQNLIKSAERELSFKLGIQYPKFMPDNVMINLLSKYGPSAAEDAVYRDCIVFTDANLSEKCLVRADEENRTVSLYVGKSEKADELARAVYNKLIELSKKAEVLVAVEDGKWVKREVLKEDMLDTLSLADAKGTVSATGFRFLFNTVDPSTRAGRGIKLDFTPTSSKAEVIEIEQAEDARITKKSIAEINPMGILFTAATPQHARQINVGYETRFKDLIREFDRRDKIQFKEEQGLSQERFRNYLFTNDPHIVHFAGHGETEGLVLQDRSLDASVLLNLVKLQHNTQVVLLNACNTLPMAKELAAYIPYVIGTPGPLSDDAAISFARGFYTGIASGRTVEDSYWYAVNSIEADGHGGGYLPVLVKRTSSTVGKTGSTAASVAVEVTSNPVVPPTTPNQKATTPKKVFLSYARPLLNEAEKLRTHLAVQRRNGKIEFWYDQAIVVGDTWDEAIKAKIEEADIFILLLSADFWASDYIHEHELPLIEQRHRAGAKVMCVMVSANDFEETNWSRLQASPRLQGRLTPIQNWNNIDDAWQAVVGDLRKLIS